MMSGLDSQLCDGEDKDFRQFVVSQLFCHSASLSVLLCTGCCVQGVLYRLLCTGCCVQVAVYRLLVRLAKMMLVMTQKI